VSRLVFPGGVQPTEVVAILVAVVTALLVALAAVRPDLWGRLFLARVDPRPLGLMRIALGVVLLWTFLDFLPEIRLFFTDEGIWLPGMARSQWGGPLRYLWDPADGFEHWWSPLRAALSVPSVLHLRSDPPIAFTLYALVLVSGMLMVLGVWTRWTTIATWVLAEQLYRYNGLFYTGGDFIIRAFLFLGMLSRWGEAYSVDAWRRQRRLIRGGATDYPGPRPIPAWPQRLMMLHLACIYAATGLLKTGLTWREGTALYYAMNLDHFYRWPATGLIAAVQHIGVLPLMTWLTRWWEMLFPLTLVGAALTAYEAERLAGTWPVVSRWRSWLSRLLVSLAWLALVAIGGIAATLYLPGSRMPVAATAAVAVAPLGVVALYRWLRQRHATAHRVLLRWVLGKRVWLGFGLLLHAGIDLTVNVGTFSQAIVVPYLCWLSGGDVDAFWRYLLSRPLRPGEGQRPRRRGLSRISSGLVDVVRYRVPGATYAIHYVPDEAGVRRAALLRFWDFGHRLRFVPDHDLPADTLRLDMEGRRDHLQGAQAGAALVWIFPALWWLGPPTAIALLRRWTGSLALRLLW
jgi:hypothetical protein